MNNVTLSFTNALDTLVVNSGALFVSSGANNKNIGGNLSSNIGIVTAGSTAPELFVYNAAGTLNIWSKLADNGIAGGLNVVFSGIGQNAGSVVLNNNNTYLGKTYVNGEAVILNNSTGVFTSNAAPSATVGIIPGDLIISGGTAGAADSTAIGQATVTFNQSSNLIATQSNVTINGGGRLNLNGFNNTIATLTFNNDGGSGSGTGADGPNVLTGVGVLSVAGLIKSQNNIVGSQVPSISGILNLTNAAPTVQVDVNKVIPGQIGLAIEAVITTAGNVGFTKTGAGVLGIGGLSPDFGTLTIGNGTVAIATTNAIIGGRVDVHGNVFDTRGLSATIGSLTGTSGTVTNFNQTTPGTLTLGFDGTNASYGGVFSSPFASGQLNIAKIGTGTQTFTGDSTATNSGALTVNDGAITVNGASGKLGFSTYVLNTGGILNVDDSATNVGNRLGGRTINTAATTLSGAALSGAMRQITLAGGTLNFTTTTGAATENLGDVTIGQGMSTLNINPGTGGFTLSMNRLIASGGLLTLNAGGTNGLGSAAAGSGVVNVKIDNVNVGGTGGTGAALTGIGASNIGLVGGNFAGIGVRADVIGVDSTGNGFVTYDLNGFRILSAAEYTPLPNQPVVPPFSALATSSADVLLNSATYETVSTQIGNLRLDSGGSVIASGGTLAGYGYYSSLLPTSYTSASFATTNGAAFVDWNAAGTLNTLTLTGGVILSNSGNGGLQGGQIAASGTNALNFDAVADLAVNAFISGGNSIVKNGAGNVTLNRVVLAAIPTTINGGQLTLNSGRDNTLLATIGATVPTYQAVVSNGGILELNGRTQAVSAINSVDVTPGGGGIIDNASASAVRLWDYSTGTTGTFGGQITGNLSFYKAGANTQILTNTMGANGYTGVTNILGGILQLRDSGALTNTSAINVNGGTLFLDNTGLSDSTTRVSATIPVNLNSGTFRVDGRQGTTDTESVNLSLNSGGNTITENAPAGSGYFTLTPGSATPASLLGAGATVNFTSTVGTFGSNAAAPRFVFNALPTTLAQLFSGAAIVNGGDFAVYLNQTNGVQIPNNNGSSNYTVLGAAAGNSPINNLLWSNQNFNLFNETTANANPAAIRFTGATFTMNSLTDTMSIVTGGLLVTGSATFTSGRITAGAAVTNIGTGTALNTALSSNLLYLHVNTNTTTLALQGQVIDDGYQSIGVVKTLAGVANFGVSPTVEGTATTAFTAGTVPGTVTLSSTTGLVAGSIQNVAIGGSPAASIITTINSGTVYGVTGGTTCSLGPADQLCLPAPDQSGRHQLRHRQPGDRRDHHRQSQPDQ